MQAAGADSPFDAIANGGQAGFSESLGIDFLLSTSEVVILPKVVT